MNNSLDKALYYLTGNGNIDTVNIDELEKLVDNHPYFPVAHFLLAKKLKKENSPHFLPEVQKTALYFPNPYWLHYQLLNDLPEEPIVYDADEPLVKERDEFVKETHENILPDSAEDSPTSHNESPVLDIDEHPITTEFSLDEIEAASNLAHQTLTEDSEVANQPSEEQEHTSLVEMPAIHSHEIVDEPYILSEERAEVVSQLEEETAAITRDTDEATTRFLEEVENTAVQHENVGDKVENSPVADPVEIDTPEEDEHEKMFQNIKAMLDASAEEANADVKTSVVPIDPYYTIDYFAAQGIKLDLENPQDKLGKQVKKFTQWLKHMKKLGPEDTLTSEGPSPAEVEAQQTADASNIAREVVTEAMATVLEKQGKNEKAIQLYRKLSFLNPHKSAYFADKIKNLNGL